MIWEQNYDPLHNVLLSTLVAAIPIVVLLGTIAFLKIQIHFAALIGLATSLIVAVGVFHMPGKAAAASAIYGAAYGLFPIGWIILNLIFLYQLTVNKGLFAVLRGNLAAIAPDPRIQLILISFSFGAFFEGAAGFGTPVAVTAAILIQLGFKPLAASGLSLIANTAPVAFGALGTPIIALNGVLGGDDAMLRQLSAMVGRQLPFFSLIVPFWVVCAFAGWRGMLGVWPAALVAGIAFAVPQFIVSNFHGPWLVDIIAALCSMAALVALGRFWRPKEIWKMPDAQPPPASTQSLPERNETVRAWLPWILLSVFVFVWGVPQVKNVLNGERTIATAAGFNKQSSALTKIDVTVPALHNLVKRGGQVAGSSAAPEKAIFTFNWLSATGTGILVAALVSGLFMGFGPGELMRIYFHTIWRVRFSLITIAAMLSLGYVTKYSGTDATLGLAMSKTGKLYPFFGTLLGWLGVALTGSDTASNVLFGSLQKISAEHVGISPVLMAAANSSGGVMGKMVDAQSIVVASTATSWYGHEGRILRYVFVHSLALAMLVGVLVFLQAYVAPFSKMVVGSKPQVHMDNR
jgi:lactate permease